MNDTRRLIRASNVLYDGILHHLRFILSAWHGGISATTAGCAAPPHFSRTAARYPCAAPGDCVSLCALRAPYYLRAMYSWAACHAAATMSLATANAPRRAWPRAGRKWRGGETLRARRFQTFMNERCMALSSVLPAPHLPQRTRISSSYLAHRFSRNIVSMAYTARTRLHRVRGIAGVVGWTGYERNAYGAILRGPGRWHQKKYAGRGDVWRGIGTSFCASLSSMDFAYASGAFIHLW